MSSLSSLYFLRNFPREKSYSMSFIKQLTIHLLSSGKIKIFLTMLRIPIQFYLNIFFSQHYVILIYLQKYSISETLLCN